MLENPLSNHAPASFFQDLYRRLLNDAFDAFPRDDVLMYFDKVNKGFIMMHSDPTIGKCKTCAKYPFQPLEGHHWIPFMSIKHLAFLVVAHDLWLTINFECRGILSEGCCLAFSDSVE